MIDTKLLTEPDAIAESYEIMRQLRPHLDPQGYIRAVQEMASEGYCLAGTYQDGHLRAVAGYHIRRDLAHGKYLYVDDLVCDEAVRSQGLGGALMDWIVAYAKQAECRVIRLDSGVVRHRAHRFYLVHGFDIVYHHFLRSL